MKRRDFLISGAIGTTIAGTVPFSTLGATKNVISQRPLRKKSLKYAMIKEDLSLMDKFKLVKDLGFDGIELESPDKLDDKEVLVARDATGLELPGLVNSLHWKKPLSDPDPAVRLECRQSIIEALDRCKRFGGTSVLVVPAVVNDKVTYDDAWERSTAELKQIIPHAEKIGIDIALENVWNNFLLSPMEAARYVDQFDSKRLGWYFDVGNVVRYGWPEQWIKILGPRIMKIDIKDYSRKKQSDEGIWQGFKVLLGDGDANYAKVNAALAAVNYKAGWGSAEVRGGDRVRLEEISERMDLLYAM